MCVQRLIVFVVVSELVVSLFVLLCVLCVCAFMDGIGVGVFSCFFGCLSVPTLRWLTTRSGYP